jgi:hypothetical protein
MRPANDLQQHKVIGGHTLIYEYMRIRVGFAPGEMRFSSGGTDPALKSSVEKGYLEKLNSYGTCLAGRVHPALRAGPGVSTFSKPGWQAADPRHHSL